MELAGIASFAELARIIATRNLGERTLRKIADDSDTSRAMQRLDAVAIAQATGLPVEFFTLPADDLTAAMTQAGQAPGTRQDVGAAIDALSAKVDELAAQQADDAARLAQLEEAASARGATGRRAGRAGAAQR